MVTWSRDAPAAASPSYRDFPGSIRSATQLAGRPASTINWPITLAMCCAKNQNERKKAPSTGANPKARPDAHTWLQRFFKRVQKERDGNGRQLLVRRRRSRSCVAAAAAAAGSAQSSWRHVSQGKCASGATAGQQTCLPKKRKNEFI